MVGQPRDPSPTAGRGYSARWGCSTCHRLDVQGSGPNLTGLFWRAVLLDDGRTVTLELYSRIGIVARPEGGYGFKPIMPSFQGIVSEEQMNALVAFVKSRTVQPAGAAGTPNLKPPTSQAPVTNK